MIPEIYPQKLPKAILFDWDNTLVDTWRVAYEAINAAREHVGREPLTIKEFWDTPHTSLRDSAKDLFGDRHEEGGRIFYEAIKKYHLEELIALQGAESVLQQIADKNILMGVVSNKHGRLLREEVSHLGWDNHFHNVVGAGDLPEDKPSPLPVRAALKASQCSPGQDVWFVGDSIVDVLCARATGCIPVVVGNGEAAQQKNIIHAKDCVGLAKLIATL